MPRKKKLRMSAGSPQVLACSFSPYTMPWLLNMFPYSYWASTCSAALPTYLAFMISVRQAGDLPPASFRFPVTRDTLALGYILPAVGRIRDFHPLEHASAGRTKKQAPAKTGACLSPYSVQESMPRLVRYFLTMRATLKVMASSNSRRSRPVSFLIFSSR